MSLGVALCFAAVALVALVYIPDAAVRLWPKHEPSPCYVCGHPGPMGELVAKLPCCVVCREAVTREADAILDPFGEARDREGRELAAAEATTDFAAKFGRLPPSFPEEHGFARLLPVATPQDQVAATVERLGGECPSFAKAFSAMTAKEFRSAVQEFRQHPENEQLRLAIHAQVVAALASPIAASPHTVTGTLAFGEEYERLTAEIARRGAAADAEAELAKQERAILTSFVDGPVTAAGDFRGHARRCPVHPSEFHCGRDAPCPKCYPEG